jgi:hypothetical protein
VAEASLPVAQTPGGGQLRLIVKRFLYNDRQEIRHSPVFGQVWKPFCAFLNPADAAAQGLNAGDVVAVGGSLVSPSQAGKSAGPTVELPVKLAAWVEPGSVVVNDLYHAQPANALYGVASVDLKKIPGVAAGGRDAAATGSTAAGGAVAGAAGGGE